MRVTGLGQVVFAVGIAALGAFTLGWHGFISGWQPLPKWIVWHDTAAALIGVILLAGGIGLLVPRTARVSSLVLAGLLLLQLLLLEVPRVAARPLVEVMWEEFSQSLIYVAGAWTIFSMLPRDGDAPTQAGSVRAGQTLFALALPAIGLSHMFYLNLTAPLIPSWLPFHVPLAYFTGACHIAAGVGILFGVLPRLAATLEAVMVSLFTLLVWVPVLMAAPANRFDWSEFCVSTVVTGAAWAVAESYRGRSWGLARGGKP